MHLNSSAPGEYMQADLKTLGLDAANFKFGRRVFQCAIPHPGVAYRNSPSFHDKVADGTGPKAPQCIIADAMVQGPKSVWVRCACTGTASGMGWLPLTDSHHARICFKHLGSEQEVFASRRGMSNDKYSGLELADGSVKLVRLKRASGNYSSVDSARNPSQIMHEKVRAFSSPS